MLRIDGPSLGDGPTCERILRALPDWFGLEDSLVEYVQDVQRMQTFMAALDGEPIGFTTIRRHFPESAEIHVMGILPDHHRRGVGRSMVEAAETWLRTENVRFLQVKTVSASRDDPNYACTRQFYLGVGFQPLEEFPLLWDAHNPCLQLVKAL